MEDPWRSGDGDAPGFIGGRLRSEPGARSWASDGAASTATRADKQAKLNLQQQPPARGSRQIFSFPSTCLLSLQDCLLTEATDNQQTEIQVEDR